MQVEPCEIPLIEDAAGGAVRGIANQPEADKHKRCLITLLLEAVKYGGMYFHDRHYFFKQEATDDR